MDDLVAIQKCLAGDWESFRPLVEKYQARAVGHALAIVGNREDALDAVQEAFLDAFRALGRFDQGRQFYPWLYTILRNRCFKLLAGRGRLEVSSLEEIQTEILAPASSLSPEELLALERALLALSPEDRELITLKSLDGLSYRELAERLGIAEGTVMSRLYYARQRLRELLRSIDDGTDEKERMNQVSCESVCLAAMAVADGEEPLIPAPDIELHLGQCDRCLGEVERLRVVIDLLNAQSHRERTESVWGRVAERLSRGGQARAASDHWPWFLLLGLFLAGYKVVAAVLDWDPGLWFKLAPALLAIAVFGLLRENPFKVNPELQAQTSDLNFRFER